MSGLARLLLTPVAALCLVLALAPLVAVIALGMPGAVAAAQDLPWAGQVLRSLLLAEAAALAAWLAGLLAALGIWGADGRIRRPVLGASLVPLLTPPGWMARGLFLAAHAAGLHDVRLAAQVAGHAAPSAALVLLILTGFLNRLDPRLMLAAAACGASAGRARRLILLPNLAGGLAVAAAASFTLSIGQAALDAALSPPDQPGVHTALIRAVQAGDAVPALLLGVCAVLSLAAAWLIGLRRRNLS